MELEHWINVHDKAVARLEIQKEGNKQIKQSHEASSNSTLIPSSTLNYNWSLVFFFMYLLIYIHIRQFLYTHFYILTYRPGKSADTGVQLFGLPNSIASSKELDTIIRECIKSKLAITTGRTILEDRKNKHLINITYKFHVIKLYA